MASSTTDRRLGLTGGTAYKAPVKAATTANITLSGEQTIDGVACVTGDRVLVKDQTTGSQNGIYVVDTGTWTRDLDFDGSNDVVQGTQVYVNAGGTANSGATFVVTTSGAITPGTTSISFSRTSSGTVTRTKNVATAGQTAFTVATYQPGSNSIEVYINGYRQTITDDYTETNGTTITFVTGLNLNDEVLTYSRVPAATLTAAAASASSVADAGDYFVGTDVESVLQEIAGGIAADNGDANATFTNASSNRVQRWNTALTANRTLTLSTSNAKEGAWCLAVRGSGATGNYTLAVGSLATLRAPGEWAKAVYDAGTAAWVLAGYGILPSAEILAMSADNADTSATLTVGTSERTQRWATALTADRTATLSATGAYTGSRFRIVRTEAATGLFALYVSAASATIATLLKGQFCDVEYTGAAWIVTQFGNVRAQDANVIRLYDDFLGEELNGYLWQSLIGTDSSCQQAILAQDQTRGLVRLTTGAGAGADMATNGCQFNGGGLNWQANQGGLIFEARLLMSAITNIAVYVGLTDQLSALEMPFTLAAGDALTSNATNAVGVLFDTAADTDNWWAVGVAADVDATKQNLAVAPVAATMETWRIEVTTPGVATFYRNGAAIGSAMTGALSASAQLVPVIAAFTRSAASATVDVDFIATQAQR